MHDEPRPSFAPDPGPSYASAQPRVVQGSTYLRDGRWANAPSYRQGRAGEDAVVERLAAGLDARWTIYRNLALSDGQGGDIDIVLLGPAGVYALEVKTYGGEWRVEEGRWFRRAQDGSWLVQPRGPGGQVRDNAVRLSRYLGSGDAGAKWFVEPVVVLGQDTPLEVRSTGTPVWTWPELDARVADLARLARYSPERVALAARALDALAEASRFPGATQTSAPPTLPQAQVSEPTMPPVSPTAPSGTAAPGLACAGCGHTLASGWRVCPNCGLPVRADPARTGIPGRPPARNRSDRATYPTRAERRAAIRQERADRATTNEILRMYVGCCGASGLILGLIPGAGIQWVFLAGAVVTGLLSVWWDARRGYGARRGLVYALVVGLIAFTAGFGPMWYFTRVLPSSGQPLFQFPNPGRRSTPMPGTDTPVPPPSRSSRLLAAPTVPGLVALPGATPTHSMLPQATTTPTRPR